MRTLIVSSQLSIDGTHGDRQSWVPDFLGEQARGEFSAAYAVQVLEALHIETYWVDEYVDAALAKLVEFYGAKL